MSTPRSDKVGYARWYEDSDANSSTAPSTTSHGVAVLNDRQCLTCYVAATKTNSAHLALYGYAETTGSWMRCDSVVMSGTTDEVERLEGVTAFTRVAVRRLDANVQAQNDVNCWYGFVEA